MDRVPLTKVLEVAEDFDRWGVTRGLIAWELCEHEAAVSPAWQKAKRGRMLKPSGRDPDTQEQLWRLTPRGRELLSAA